MYDLFADRTVRQLLVMIAKEGRINAGDLSSRIGIGFSELERYTARLTAYNLVEKRSCLFPELSSYLITARGLGAERNLRRWVHNFP